MGRLYKKSQSLSRGLTSDTTSAILWFYGKRKGLRTEISEILEDFFLTDTFLLYIIVEVRGMVLLTQKEQTQRESERRVE